MDGPRRSGPPTDPAEEGRSWRPSIGYLAIALALVAGGLASWLMLSASPTPVVADAATQAPVLLASSGSMPAATIAPSSPAPGAPPRAVAAAIASTPGATLQVSRTRDPNSDPTPDLSDYLNRGEKPAMSEVIDRLHQAGVQAGLGAFSPPGTRPPLVGLAVPDDFVLPEGYVRHYQATDDGQRIEPILMFSPDHDFFDAAHRPITVPPDRVVPPEFAPPGLPIRRIVIPAPAESGRPGR
jgi:hypothetical protein